MSTPRHDCKTDDRKLAIDRPCSACSAGDSEMEHHDHCPPFREGVAAPLEPTRLITTQAQEEARIFKDDNIKLYAELEAAEARIRELEKEIAALRKVVG